MRRLFNIYKQDNTPLPYGDELFYTYDSLGNLIPTNTPESEVEIVLSNGGSPLNKHYIVDGLKKLANAALLKAPDTDSISLSRFSEYPADGSVLVGQGVNSPAIWKTFDSIFPSTVYEVKQGEALRYEGTTMVSSYFQNTDLVIYNYQIINKKPRYNVVINKITNPSTFYSSATVSVNYIPVIANITSINGTPATNGSLGTKNFMGFFHVNTQYDYDISVVKYTVYMSNNISNTVRPIECTIEVLPTSTDGTKNFKFYLPLTFVAQPGDDILYLGDVTVKTSLTDKYRYITNLVINDIDQIIPYYTYNTEIKGISNSISSTLPVNLNITSIGIGEHHGFYIDLVGKLNSFGTDMRGEISKKPTGRFEHVACGLYHSVAIDSNGKLISWGSDDFRQVSDTPSGVFKQVYAKFHMSAAISEDDVLFIWGDPIFSAVDSTVKDVQEVAIGEKHILVLRKDGSLVVIGDNTYGQYSNKPLGQFKKIASGKYHCAAINIDGTLYTWGSNDDRQLTNASSITGQVIDVVCTDFGGGALTLGNVFKPFGDITQTGVQTYNKMSAGNYNIVLLKNSQMNIQKDFVKRAASGDAYDMSLIIDVPDVAITKIYVDLDVLE